MMVHDPGNRLVGGIGAALLGARFLLVPFYLGLVVALGVLLAKFGLILLDGLRGFADLSSSGALVLALKLIDFSLVANLLLIVMQSGWSGFVAPLRRSDIASAGHDFSEVKLKVLGSICAIAAIDLLESFLDIEHASPTALRWELAIFLGFVAATALLAWADRLGHAASGDH